MSAADTDTEESTVWSIRGVPSSLVEDVKAASRRENMNIGQFVSLSLKKFFDEYAQQSNSTHKINYVDEKVAEAEKRLSAELAAQIEAKFDELVQKRQQNSSPPRP